MSLDTVFFPSVYYIQNGKYKRFHSPRVGTKQSDMKVFRVSSRVLEYLVEFLGNTLDNVDVHMLNNLSIFRLCRKNSNV